MTQEDKELLLQDLCTRLPYGVKINVRSNDTRTIRMIDMKDGIVHFVESDSISPFGVYIEHPITFRQAVKPYLRPMSSMTEEEKVGYNLAADRDLDRMAEKVGRKLQGNENLDETLTPYYEHIDWLNSHHFDYRGLIPMGLALEAPEGMYKEE